MAEIVRMPHMSDTMTEGVIVAWHKKVGDKVKTGDILAEIETDKAVMEFESFQEGTLLYIGAEKGKAVPVDSVIAVIGKEGEDYKAALEGTGTTTKTPAAKEAKPEHTATANTAAATPAAATVTDTGRIKVSPLAKKIATDSGINLSQVRGTGDDGRIVKRDIEAFLTGAPKSSAQPVAAAPFVAGKESYEDVPLSQMRKTIARRLAESKFTAPHFYLTMEINMDKMIDARRQINEFSGQKISFNDIVIKAAALSLRKNPKVNSSWLGDKIRYHHHIHIGMAVAIEDGLIVPVIKFADQKSLVQISVEAKMLGTKAKERKLQPSDWEGNTFSISNLGMMDIEEFTAIINPPDSCILAVGRIKEVLKLDNGNVKTTHVMKVTLSCDHRAVDGATGTLFLQTLKNYLESPVSLML